MLTTSKPHVGFFHPEFKSHMRAHLMRLTLHFLVGIVLGAFLLPEGAVVVVAGATVAAGVKAFYDYLNNGVNLLACACLAAGALAVLLTTL